MNGKSRSHLGAAAVTGLALIVRLAHVTALRGSPLFDTLFGDAGRYDRWAMEIAGGSWLGTGTFYQSPLYPYLLAGLYALFGHQLLLVRLFQALLGAVACGLVALAGERLFGRTAGLAAGIFVALYAPAVFYDGLVQKASLDFFLAAALVFLVSRIEPDAAKLVFAGLGVTLGLLILNRENALLLLPLFLVYAWLRAGRSRAASALLLAGVALVLGPIAFRNRIVGGEWTLTTAQFGTNLYYGNHEGADGSYRPLRAGRGAPEFELSDATAIAERAVGRPLDATGVSAYWRDQALSWMREHPRDAAALFAKKTALVWRATEAMDHEDIYSHAAVSPALAALLPLFQFGALAPLALLGIWTTGSRRAELWIFHAFLAVYTLSIAVFLVVGRYRHPLVPVLAIFLGAAVSWLSAELRARRWRSFVPAAASVALMALLWNLDRPDVAAMRARTEANLARALAEAGKSEEAVAAYRHSLDLDADSPRVLVALGTLFADLGRGNDAEVCAQKALRLDRNLASAHNLMGTLFATAGELPGAISAFSNAAKLESDRADYLFNLGTALAGAGQREPAIAALRRATELDPRCGTCHNNLGIALAQSGRLEEAAREFRAALDLDPGNLDVRQNLERALRAAAPTAQLPR